MRTIGYLLTYVALAVGGFFGTAWCFQAGNEEKPAAAAAAPAAAAPKGAVKATAASGPFCRSYHIMTMGNMCYWYIQDCTGTGWTSEINTCTAPFGPCCTPGPTCLHCSTTHGADDNATVGEEDEAENRIAIDPELGQNGVTPITSKAPVSVGVTEKIKRRHIIEFDHPTSGQKIKAQFVLIFTKPYKDAAGKKHDGAHFGIGRQIHSADAPDDVDQYISGIEEVPGNPKAVRFLWNEDELPENIQCMVVLAQ
jgi:hypothetical protein